MNLPLLFIRDDKYSTVSDYMFNLYLEKAGIDINYTVKYWSNWDVAEELLYIWEQKYDTKFMLVPMSANFLSGLLPGKSLESYRGSLLEHEGHRIVPCIDPQRIFERKRYFRDLIQLDLTRAKKYSDTEKSLDKYTVKILDTLDSIKSELDTFYKSGKRCIAVDIETYYRYITHFSFCFSNDKTACIPFYDLETFHFGVNEEAEIWRLLGKMLEDKRVHKIAHSAVFEGTFFYDTFGIVCNPLHDTMIQQNIANPEMPKALDFVTSLCGDGFPYYKDDGKEKGTSTVYSALIKNVNTFRRYNALDSLVTYRAFFWLQSQLKQQKNIAAYKEQRRLIHPCVFMGSKGIKADTDEMKRQSIKLRKEIKQIERRFYDKVGKYVNMASNKEMHKLFYNDLGAQEVRKNGRVTLDADALLFHQTKDMKEAHILQDHRKKSKFDSTYLNMPIDKDGRIRSSINPAGTWTGRLRSKQTVYKTGCNFQNLPKGMKTLLTPDDGYIVISVDLNQAENRCVAFLAEEKRMMEAFNTGKDVHKLTASLMFNIPIEEVEDDPGDPLSQRNKGKRANHSLNYGFGAKAFALKYGMPLWEAQQIHGAYHKVYNLRRYWNVSVQQAVRHGFIENLLGRRFYFTDKRTIFDDHKVKMQIYAANPQSSVGSLMNWYGVNYFYYNPQTFHEGVMMNQVHDSLDFAWPADKIGRLWNATGKLQQSLEKKLVTPNGLDFTIPVSINIGYSYGKMLEISSDEFRNVKLDKFRHWIRNLNVLEQFDKFPVEVSDFEQKIA